MCQYHWGLVETDAWASSPDVLSVDLVWCLRISISIRLHNEGANPRSAFVLLCLINSLERASYFLTLTTACALHSAWWENTGTLFSDFQILLCAHVLNRTSFGEWWRKHRHVLQSFKVLLQLCSGGCFNLSRESKPVLKSSFPSDSDSGKFGKYLFVYKCFKQAGSCSLNCLILFFDCLRYWNLLIW